MKVESGLVGDILGKKKTRLQNKPSEAWVLPDTSIGVEVELEGVPLRTLGLTLPPEVDHYWSFSEDNSLHNNGAEFTFKSPMFGEDSRVALGTLLSHAERAGWLVSKRTGIHVHVDARDLSRHQLLGFVAYYLLFEPLIYEWVGDDRHSNNFCLPYYKAEVALFQAKKILFLMHQFSLGIAARDEVLNACDRFHRYSGLNLKSLLNFGSLEFRHLKTTLSYPRVRDWINIILCLKRAALNTPQSTYTILGEVSKMGVEVAVERIFSGLIPKEMVTKEIVSKIMGFGIPNATELLEVSEAENPREEQAFTWGTELNSHEDGLTHNGAVLWKEATFPKGLKPSPEEPRPQKIKVVLPRMFRTQLVDAPVPAPPPDPPPDLTNELITAARNADWTRFAELRQGRWENIPPDNAATGHNDLVYGDLTLQPTTERGE